MARAIWSGAISFGLVMVPVKVYSAVSRKDVRFNQLHGADGGRIQQKRVCAVDGEEVPYEEIVKGYEIEPGRYVTITPAELDSVAAERTRRIEIEEFVALDDIDPIHWETTYYLAPDKTAGKPYALLLAALESTSRVGLGRVVLRSKEYLAAIRPARDALMLSTMLFADEIVPRAAVEEFGEEPAEVSPKELAIAEQLVGSLSADWDPDRYKDTYYKDVMGMIKERVKAGQLEEAPEVPEEKRPAARSNVVDLMALLKQSVEDKGGRRAGAKPGKKPAARKTAHKTTRKTA